MYFRYGLTQAEAGSRFFILDDKGLITKARSNLKELEENFYSLTTFAEDDTSMEGMQLLEVCMYFTVLHNCSKCEVRAARCENFTICLPLRFYVKLNFGEFKWSKNVIFGTLEGSEF